MNRKETFRANMLPISVSPSCLVPRILPLIKQTKETPPGSSGTNAFCPHSAYLKFQVKIYYGPCGAIIKIRNDKAFTSKSYKRHANISGTQNIGLGKSLFGFVFCSMKATDSFFFFLIVVKNNKPQNMKFTTLTLFKCTVLWHYTLSPCSAVKLVLNSLLYLSSLFKSSMLTVEWVVSRCS